MSRTVIGRGKDGMRNEEKDGIGAWKKKEKDRNGEWKEVKYRIGEWKEEKQRTGSCAIRQTLGSHVAGGTFRAA